jgi:hypothetical protein
MRNDIKVLKILGKLGKSTQLRCVLKTISVIWPLPQAQAIHLSTRSVGIMPYVVFPVKYRQAFPEFFSSNIAGHVCKTRTFSAPHRQKSGAVSSGYFEGQKRLRLGKGIVLDKTFRSISTGKPNRIWLVLAREIFFVCMASMYQDQDSSQVYSDNFGR